MAERLIVALDVPTIEGAAQLADQLDGIVSFFKIGLWLLFAPGAEAFIDRLIANGKRVFLDAKMYDIGETVRQGVARATERGVSIVTVHGDPEIMRAAVAGKGGSSRTKVFAISVLTSQNDDDLREMGIALPVAELVRCVSARRWSVAVTASSARPPMIRTRSAEWRMRSNLLIATPGIREPGGAVHDQKRHATPAQAIARGADYLVVGRPITQANDPAVAAERIIADMESGRS